MKPESETSILGVAKGSGLGSLVALFVSSYALDYGLFVLSWWLLGRAVLSGEVDSSLLTAWAMLFAVMLPFRALSSWSEGRIAVTAGGLLKQRLLLGALRLEPDEMRSDGAGRHLARVFESEAVESLALSGGLLSAAASIELVVALGIVSVGAGGISHAGFLVLSLAAFVLLARRYLRERRLWTEERLAMSHELLERMVGHRTRLVQERPERRHEGEDEALERYEARSRRVDGRYALLQTLPRVWLPLGIAALALPSLRGEANIAEVAAGLGGTILAYRALVKLADGFSDLLDAGIAWTKVRDLFRAAGRPTAAREKGGPGSALVEARNVYYRYDGGAAPVLADVGFTIERGDRVLLTSPSGGGKSTLLSLVNGLRRPSSGVILEGGTVATAPQYHENHVFTETFLFNLLMGRRWPPTGADILLAETICREVGLGELLEKMPGGMNQLVGDTGWQLSHGERSRLFLARALLQGCELVLLDESFAALDPENLRQALLTARKRAESLVVVAHP
jgi:ATP-binding cassette subfamily B protein